MRCDTLLLLLLRYIYVLERTPQVYHSVDRSLPKREDNDRLAKINLRVVILNMTTDRHCWFPFRNHVHGRVNDQQQGYIYEGISSCRARYCTWFERMEACAAVAL